MRFAIFPVHLSKVLCLPGKIDARSYEVLHLSRKSILANLYIWYSKMQPLSRNQRPDLLTSLMNMSFVLRLPRKMHLCRSSSNVPCLPSFLEMPKTLTFCSLLKRYTIPCACHAKRHLNGANMWCFVHFNLEMCFAPQRRTLFRHLNFQKWSDHGVLCTFWLQNVFRAATPCTFSSSQLPKLLRTLQFLTHFTSKYTSRHNAVHFFNISTSKSGPILRRFVPFYFEIGFAPQRRTTFHLSSPHMSPYPPLYRAYFSTLRSHKTTKKHSVSRLSYLFAHLHLLSSDLFSSDSSPCWLLFHLPILSEVWLLNFLRLGSVSKSNFDNILITLYKKI